MRQGFAVILFLVLWMTSSSSLAAACVYTAPPRMHDGLQRGVNLSRWWENDRRESLSQDDIANLHMMGFDFVRLPFSSKWFDPEDGQAQQDNINQLRCDLISLLNQNFVVVLDLHTINETLKDYEADPSKLTARLEAVWTALKPAIADLPPDRVFISILNEPKMDPGIWWTLQGEVIKNLRDSFPKNTFVVTAAPDGGPWNLELAQPYEDKNVLYDFHFYQPMFLTHHGANWFPSDSPEFKTVTIYYPVGKDNVTDETDPDVKQYVGEGWGRAKLAGFINKVARWGQENSAHVACLEFGVYRAFLDARSRANWIKDMRDLLDNSAIPWALWEYRGSFGLLDNSDLPDEAMESALGLNSSHGP